MAHGKHHMGHILQYDDKISGQSLAESVSAVLESMSRLQQIPCQIHCPFSLCREMRFTYLNAHAKVKNDFSLISKEIGLCLVSFQMICEALQSKVFRFKFHSLSSKIL